MPNAVANGLRVRGLDVTTSGEAGLLAARDEEQLAFGDARHSGIIYWTQRNRTLGQLIGSLATLSIDYNAEDLKDRVMYL
jgi:hypothetical protein